jgi:hypothetical protein
MNTIRYISNVDIIKEKEYNFKFNLEQLQIGDVGEYYICIMPSSYGSNVQSANTNGNLYCLDPWYNITSSTTVSTGWASLSPSAGQTAKYGIEARFNQNVNLAFVNLDPDDTSTKFYIYNNTCASGSPLLELSKLSTNKFVNLSSSPFQFVTGTKYIIVLDNASAPFTWAYDNVGGYPYTNSIFNITNGSQTCTPTTVQRYAFLNFTFGSSILAYTNINLISPTNNILSINTAPTFSFNFTSNDSNIYNCTLWANATLSVGKINCSQNIQYNITSNTTLNYNTTYNWFVNTFWNTTNTNSSTFNYTTVDYYMRVSPYSNQSSVKVNYNSTINLFLNQSNYNSSYVKNVSARLVYNGTPYNYTTHLNTTVLNSTWYQTVYNSAIGLVNYSWNVTICYNDNTCFNTTYNFNYSIIAFNLNIYILNEVTNTNITELITLTYTSLSTQNNITITNAYKNLTNLTPEFYSFLFQSVNYSERIYTVTIADIPEQSLYVYLSHNNISVPISIYVKDTGGNPLQANIILQRFENNNWVTIATQTADILGYMLFYLDEGYNYKWILSMTGYDTRQFLLTPYQANSPYTFKLTSIALVPFIPNSYNISYLISPSDTFVNPNLTTKTFSITTSSPSGSLSYTRTLCNFNGVVYSANVSGSPNGGTADVVINILGNIGLVYCNFTFGNINGQTSLFPRVYNVGNFTSSVSNSLNNTLQQAKTDFNDDGWTVVIAFFVILALCILLYELTKNNLISIVTGFGGLIFFGLIGWIPLSAVIFVLIIGGIWLYFNR